MHDVICFAVFSFGVNEHEGYCKIVRNPFMYQVCVPLHPCHMYYNYSRQRMPPVLLFSSPDPFLSAVIVVFVIYFVM
jgi:hypothetical protein